MKRFQNKRAFVFISLNAALYVPITIFDAADAARGVTPAQGVLCDVLKYAAILSCFFLCLFSRRGSRAARVQTIVFVFTLAADFFLLFTPYFTCGVLVFLGAHLTAVARYRPKWTPRAAIAACVLFFIVLLGAQKWLPEFHGILSALLPAACAAYAALILTVTAGTFRATAPRGNVICARIGMLLFLACDANVAIFNMLPVGAPAHTASIVLMWLFYLPAQTLLAASAATQEAPRNDDETHEA